MSYSLMMLAETRLAEISLQYREEVASGSGFSFWYVLIPIALAAIGLTAFYFSDRPPVVTNTPQGLLHELCRAHKIRGLGRRLLERITEDADLDHPAIVFTDRKQFELAVTSASQHAGFSKRDENTIGALRRRLF